MIETEWHGTIKKCKIQISSKSSLPSWIIHVPTKIVLEQSCGKTKIHNLLSGDSLVIMCITRHQRPQRVITPSGTRLSHGQVLVFYGTAGNKRILTGALNQLTDVIHFMDTATPQWDQQADAGSNMQRKDALHVPTGARSWDNVHCTLNSLVCVF